MSDVKPDLGREKLILDAAADLIIRYGYDKTRMSDVADAAGVTRAIVYQHFKSKEGLFEALLYHETKTYMQAWLEGIESNPEGGTLAGVFRSSLSAVKRSPFMSAMLKRDRRVFGSYVRTPDNLFEPMQSNTIWVETLHSLQQVGAIRSDVVPEVMAHIMNALSLGLIAIESDKISGETPPFDDILETVAIIIDRTLMPKDGGNQEAGKAIILRLAHAAQSQFEQITKIIDARRSSRL